MEELQTDTGFFCAQEYQKISRIVADTIMFYAELQYFLGVGSE